MCEIRIDANSPTFLENAQTKGGKVRNYMDYSGVDFKQISKRQLSEIVLQEYDHCSKSLVHMSEKKRNLVYGKQVLLIGLIEFSNYCKNGCYYCGINIANTNLLRYRLSDDEIVTCCRNAYSKGIRTFMLQSGEDPFYCTEYVANIIKRIKENLPDCTIALSIGELNEKAYEEIFAVGTDMYMLRHETINEYHYSLLHPPQQTLGKRLSCIKMLQKIGCRVGIGFMVGSPWQKLDDLTEELLFIRDMSPDMVSVGPFIPHNDTFFKDQQVGSVATTKALMALIRLLQPDVMLPLTTATKTLLMDDGMECLPYANVLMPNITPVLYQKQYSLYNGKTRDDITQKDEITCLIQNIRAMGYEPIYKSNACKG